MVIHFSHLTEHANAVCFIYRTLLRNTINLSKLNTKDHTKLIRKIRTKFRDNSNAVNSMLVHLQMKDAVTLNDLIVDSYTDNHKLQQLISRLNPSSNESIAEPVSEDIKELELPTISNKIRKNPYYSGLTYDEIMEFRQTRKIELPESTNHLIPNMHIHSKWVFDTKHYPPMKSNLDKRYMKTIFPSLVAYEKQRYYLDKLVNKLNNPPSHKLRRVSGTGHWIYLINTPWNRDLRTENFKFLGDSRRQYDELIIKIQECENYRNKHEYMFLEEAKWENITTNSNKSTKEWTWLFDEAESLYNREKQELETKITDFCKRQGIIYEKIKPLFDKMHNHSKFNSEIMKLDLANLQNGPFTDIIDGGLGNILKKYGFKDPLETKYLKKSTPTPTQTTSPTKIT